MHQDQPIQPSPKEPPVKQGEWFKLDGGDHVQLASHPQPPLNDADEKWWGRVVLAGRDRLVFFTKDSAWLV